MQVVPDNIQSKSDIKPNANKLNRKSTPKLSPSLSKNLIYRSGFKADTFSTSCFGKRLWRACVRSRGGTWVIHWRKEQPTSWGFVDFKSILNLSISNILLLNTRCNRSMQQRMGRPCNARSQWNFGCAAPEPNGWRCLCSAMHPPTVQLGSVYKICLLDFVCKITKRQVINSGSTAWVQC